MYTKSLITSALLASCVAATSHEVWQAAPVAPQAQTPPPAAHVAPPTHAAPPAPPVANVHKQEQPPAMQYTPPPAAMAPPMAQPPMGGVKGAEHQQLTVHLVAVGDNNGSLKYFPDTVHAMPGDVVQFQFHPKVCKNSSQSWCA
jgi:hypothetical protein